MMLNLQYDASFTVYMHVSIVYHIDILHPFICVTAL